MAFEQHIFAISLALVGFLSFIYLYKFFLKITGGKFESDVKMTGKVILITGANGAIGKEMTMDLAKRGAKIIMACRNLKTAYQVRNEIIEETKNEQIVVKKLDISSQQSVRDFSADISKTETVIDVLVHIAGYVSIFKKAQSVDGIEMTFATNHYGMFLLTHLLIDLVKKSKQGRIVIFASKNHQLGPVDLNNLNPVNFLAPFQLYNISKRLNILFTVELAKRLKGTNVTANCLHPGVVDTGMFHWMPFPLSLLKLIFRTPLDGAQTSIYLACSPEVENISGKYFRACKVAEPNRKAVDENVAEKLWKESVKIVKLSENDPRI